MERDFSSAWSSVLAGGADTIVARATPAGRGGLAVIRVSGEAVRQVAAAVCPEVEVDRGWRATLVELVAADGEVIERGIVTPYPAPRSYTGEDMLEISVHGSPWVVQATIDALLAAGARPAVAGEFTRRAVANGKLDLVQAEAVNDLVAAETAWQARLARAQAQGDLSRELGNLRDALLDVLASIEGAIDFGQHDIAYDDSGVRAATDCCAAQIEDLLSTAAAGRRIRDGARVVIVGPPNSGKSTLFNVLVGRERAIVSPHPGTTRDLVEAEVEIAGVRVVLVDTAGVGESEDPVDREGVRRAHGAAAAADAVIVLWPADGAKRQAFSVDQSQANLAVRSKWDLASTEPEDGWLAVSCRTGDGVDELRCALEELVAGEVVDLGSEVAIAERHRIALTTALSELEDAEISQPELAAEAVARALKAVRELTGEVATEDLLDRVFSAFCIGK